MAEKDENSSNNEFQFTITEKPPLEFNNTSKHFIFTIKHSDLKYAFDLSKDRNGFINGNNTGITIFVNDSIKFINKYVDHPLVIKDDENNVITESTESTESTEIIQTFRNKGVYTYYCASHPNTMYSNINVIDEYKDTNTITFLNLGRYTQTNNIIDNVTIYAQHCNININSITNLDHIRPSRY